MITPVVLHEDAFYEYFKPYRHPDACHDIWGGLLRGEVAHVLGDFHRAETRAAHRAEVRDLVGLLLALMQELGHNRYAFLRSPGITVGRRSILSVLVHNYRNYGTMPA